MKIYDISRDLIKSLPYPGDEPPRLRAVHRMKDGESYNLSRLETSMHAGTHVDAPLHFIADGKDIAAMSLSAFVGECVVLTVPKTPLDAMYFMKRPFAPRILLHGKGQLTESAIGYLYNQGCVLIGTDSQSIGSYSDELSVHVALLGYGVAVLENLELRNVPDGRYMLYAAPLKISGAEGAPCRAVLISDEEEPQA
ncbi:Kynurenine formamidase [bioreactor metagenome]|uniref:Kynurenine formamidase n=1 Tax=bioreactor metagenome TaxID=1076179 RepID=A0A645DE04_9ZZZZ|nr:cyclase family protein [Christensenella sp.]